MAKEREQNIQEDEEEEVKEISHEKDYIIQDLKEKIKNFEALSQENDKNSAILAKLFEGGIIDEEGELMDKEKDEEEM